MIKIRDEQESEIVKFRWRNQRNAGMRFVSSRIFDNFRSSLVMDFFADPTRELIIKTPPSEGQKWEILDICIFWENVFRISEGIFKNPRFWHFREVWLSEFEWISSFFKILAYLEGWWYLSRHNGVLVGTVRYWAWRRVSGREDVSMGTSARQWVQGRVSVHKGVLVGTRAWQWAQGRVSGHKSGLVGKRAG